MSHGYICPKGTALADLHHDPDRLRRPLKKVGDGFEECSWDEAFAIVGDNLRRIRREHGRDAIGMYVGNPSAHSPSAMYLEVLRKVLRSRNVYSASSVDQFPQYVAYLEMFGDHAVFPVADVDRTDHLLILGANPAVSNGSITTMPDARGRIKAIRKRGGTVVVVDPRRTETARIADNHVAVRPGGDPYLLAGMLHVLFDDGLPPPPHLGGRLSGWDELRDLVAPWTPERASGPSGVAADTIRRPGPRVRRGRACRRLRPHRRVPPHDRVGHPLAGQRAQRRDRQPRPGRGADVLHAAGGPGLAAADRRRPVGARPLAQPRARPARARRRAARGHARGRDPHPRRGPGPRDDRPRRQPVPVDPGRGAAGPRLHTARLPGLHRPVRDRDQPSRRRDPAADVAPRAGRVRPDLPLPRGAQQRPVLAGGDGPARRQPPRLAAHPRRGQPSCCPAPGSRGSRSSATCPPCRRCCAPSRTAPDGCCGCCRRAPRPTWCSRP